MNFFIKYHVKFDYIHADGSKTHLEDDKWIVMTRDKVISGKDDWTNQIEEWEEQIAKAFLDEDFAHTDNVYISINSISKLD